MTSESPVAFREGEYTHKSRHGTVCMVVPRDITLEEVSQPLMRMVQARQEAARERRA